MARVSTLGPSVAPRSGESSTVHGAAFFWVESFYIVKSETHVKAILYTCGIKI
ncbi:predicted protein [Arabidopsis lyrata subsp. lyrata]|uniref:Predicted protein n=1 Tax=Arabidopsis lyrata subsp. lyrata TaxID=81972 RepID=D7MIJ3_ARALL|nr:predicted protein [Arabidopsis lyrata subsp. lyrata]